MNEIINITHIYNEDILTKLIELYNLLLEVNIPSNHHRIKDAGIGRTISFGYTFKYIGQTVVPSRGNFLRNGKRILQLLDEIAKYYKIDYTTVALNHNYQTKRHFDVMNRKGNTLISFGDYKGGELVVETSKGDITIDTYLCLVNFNGDKLAHWNLPVIEGNKYSIIYYCSRKVPLIEPYFKIYSQTPLEELEELEDELEEELELDPLLLVS